MGESGEVFVSYCSNSHVLVYQVHMPGLSAAVDLGCVIPEISNKISIFRT